jgi:hypothetical protein
VHWFAASNVKHCSMLAIDKIADGRTTLPDTAFNIERRNFQRNLRARELDHSRPGVEVDALVSAFS